MKQVKGKRLKEMCIQFIVAKQMVVGKRLLTFGTSDNNIYKLSYGKYYDGDS